jgi:hypothetical protein
MAEGAKGVPAWAAAAEESPREAARLLYEIVARYKTEREADWSELLRGPLEAVVCDLTAKHAPRALGAEEAAWLVGLIARFGRVFPETYAAVRLCGVRHGLQAIIDALAAAEVSAEAWREARLAGADPGRAVTQWHADARHGRVRAWRQRVKRDLRWVV